MMKIIACAALAFVVLNLSGVRADNYTDLLESARKNYEAKRYFKAMEDLDWAKKELNKLHFAKLKDYLPKDVSGYTFEDSGGDAFVLTGLERTFTQEGSGNNVTINIISGSAASGAGGFGALMNMFSGAAAMSANAEMVIVKGRRGNLMPTDEDTATLNFSLTNSVSVMLESNGFSGTAEVKKFAELIDFDGLEKEFQ